MLNNSIRRLVIAGLALFLLSGLFLADSNAQRRRRKRRPSAPRITNPAIYQPSPTDSDNANTSTPSTDDNGEPKPTRPATEDPDATIRKLSGQVDKLTQKIGQMEESQRSLVDLERLSRAEQRSASLRTELQTAQAKEAELEARGEEIDYALKPENIERSVAGYGTTHPEELREQRRKQLESEKERVKKQLEQVRAGDARLQQAIATSDAEVERLRKRLDAADQSAIENAKTKGQDAGAADTVPVARPTPSPDPPR